MIDHKSVDAHVLVYEYTFYLNSANYFSFIESDVCRFNITLIFVKFITLNE